MGKKGQKKRLNCSACRSWVRKHPTKNLRRIYRELFYPGGASVAFVAKIFYGQLTDLALENYSIPYMWSFVGIDDLQCFTIVKHKKKFHKKTLLKKLRYKEKIFQLLKIILQSYILGFSVNLSSQAFIYLLNKSFNSRIPYL